MRIRSTASSLSQQIFSFIPSIRHILHIYVYVWDVYVYPAPSFERNMRSGDTVS